MNLSNLETWLTVHSTKVERRETEIIFTHAGGETSILIPHPEEAGPIIEVNIEPLTSFYRRYSGASIGESHIQIATNLEGGVQLSHGFRLPDLNQMSKQARELEVPIGKDQQVFIAEAAWMFIYTVTQKDGRTIIRKYDRDFGTNGIVLDLDEVLESWWKIVEADL